MRSQRELSIKRRKDAVDRISELPDNLRESILDRVPITDAIKTSVLSPQWRYIWTARKRLDFDEEFVNSIDRRTRKKFIEIIDNILFLHRGSVEYVSLHIPKCARDDTIDLNAWLLIWSEKGMQELDINAYEYFHTACRFFPLPSMLFECLSLRYLKLSCVTLNPLPDSGGFISLVTLHLWGVSVSLDFLQTVISRCRQLEKLHVNCKFIGRCYGTKPLIINALNLRTLEFWDLTSGTIVFENVPHLSTVTLGSCMYTQGPAKHPMVHSPFHLLYSLRKIETLVLDLPLFEHLDGVCPDSLRTLFVNLHSLRLFYVTISKREDIAFIFWLLRSAPNLSSLDIQIYQKSVCSPEAVEAGLEGLEVEEMRYNNLEKLVTVNIGLTKSRNGSSWNMNYEPIFKFVRILLSSCPILERLLVDPNWKREPDAVKLNWLKKSLEFCRSSSRAELIIS